MGMVIRNKEVYRNSITGHRKIKLDFLKEIVKNIPARCSFLEGVENKWIPTNIKKK